MRLAYAAAAVFLIVVFAAGDALVKSIKRRFGAGGEG